MKLSSDELTNLAASWIAFWKAAEDEREALFWVMDKEYDLMQNYPQEVWRLILEILKLDDSNNIQEVLAAGPLEELLAQHGEFIINQVEAEAKTNPKFASLLGGVWKNSMSDEIWNKVQTLSDKSGWI